MKPIWVHHTQPGYRDLVRFITERIWGDDREMTLGTVMAVVDQDAVQAAILFHNFDSGSGVVEISGAADTRRWLTRNVLWEMFAYPFTELGCQALVARCDPENNSLARIFKAYGFQRWDIPRLRGRDKPEALYMLTDDAWAANGFHKEHGQDGQKRTEADRSEGD